MSHDLQAYASLLPVGVNIASREGILWLEDLMNTHADEEWEDLFPVIHRFVDGIYAREVFLPAGTLVVGKIHKYEHLNTIIKGDVSVATEFGIERLGPGNFISKAGTKRVVYAHSDTIWTIFHRTVATTPEDAEVDVICKTYADFDQLSIEGK